ncbi:transcriptional regulator ERG, partial [Pan troglodytes]
MIQTVPDPAAHIK